MGNYAGVDWAADKHDMRVCDEAGEELAARRALVLALVAAIRPLVEQIKQLDGQIAVALHEHPDGKIFLSLFRDPRSVVTAAELLSEIGDWVIVSDLHRAVRFLRSPGNPIPAGTGSDGSRPR